MGHVQFYLFCKKFKVVKFCLKIKEERKQRLFGDNIAAMSLRVQILVLAFTLGKDMFISELSRLKLFVTRLYMYFVIVFLDA